MFRFHEKLVKCLIVLILSVGVFSMHAQAGDTQSTKPIDVVFETTLGNFIVRLNEKAAPKTVANFVNYVNQGFYENTIFHRTIKNFMVQGGGFNEGMIKKDTQPPIKNEANNGLKNTKGAIAMARTGDPHSATAQFFINVQNNDFLDHSGETSRGWGYAVFGEVIEGLDVVIKMSEVKAGRKAGHQNVPFEVIKVKKAYLKAHGK